MRRLHRHRAHHRQHIRGSVHGTVAGRFPTTVLTSNRSTGISPMPRAGRWGWISALWTSVSGLMGRFLSSKSTEHLG